MSVLTECAESWQNVRKVAKNGSTSGPFKFAEAGTGVACRSFEQLEEGNENALRDYLKKQIDVQP